MDNGSIGYNNWRSIIDQLYFFKNINNIEQFNTNGKFTNNIIRTSQFNEIGIESLDKILEITPVSNIEEITLVIDTLFFSLKSCGKIIYL